MCGRYLFFGVEDSQEIRNILAELSKKYSDEKIEEIKRGEIFPTNDVPVLINKDGNNSYEIFKWGFKNFKSKSVIINAKSETIDGKIMFKNILCTKRCMIPANGFYEWKDVNGKKEKYFIRPFNRDFFYMAGLYNSFNLNGIYTTCFVIITTNANEEMSKIHTRMPVILKKSNEDEWLKTCSINTSNYKGILQPYGGDLSIEKVG